MGLSELENQNDDMPQAGEVCADARNEQAAECVGRCNSASNKAVAVRVVCSSRERHMFEGNMREEPSVQPRLRV